MVAQTFDILIIGGGPGGYVAAIRAAQLGKKVALVEKEKLGGTCLNWGCIPTKSLLKNAEIYRLLQHSEDFGISIEGASFNWEKIIDRSRKVADQIAGGVEYLMRKNKVALFPGAARLASPTSVEVTHNAGKTEELKATAVILATGARPRAIPGVKFDGQRVISSKEAMVLSAPPKSMIIIGAGAIGVEFAYFYNAFGVKVTLLEMEKQLLPLEDEEVSATLAKAFTQQGMEILRKTKVEGITPSGNNVAVKVSGDKGVQTLSADVALVAIGVEANLEGLGADKLGVKLAKGFIDVDDQYRTNLPGLYAIGDVAGPPWLAHVASHEGIVAVEGICGGKGAHSVDYSNIPNCVYCQPQVASIGLTEKAAREKGLKIKMGKFPFQANGKAKAIGETAGFVKMVFGEEYGELLGAQIIGSEATEMIAEVGLAKALEATSDDILRTMHAHPTLSEAIMEASGAALNQAIHL